MKATKTLALCLLSMLAVPATAAAQDGFQVDQFEPLPAQGTNLLNLSKSEVLGHLKPSFGLFLNVQDDPLQVVDADTGEVISRAVDYQAKAELHAALGLADWVDIGLAIPFVLSQSGEGSDDLSIGDFSGFALSDIRLIPKLRILDNADFGGIGLAFIVPVHFPTGDTETFNSDGGVRAEPRVALDFVSDYLSVVANVGVDFRPSQTSQNYTAGTAIRYGLGAQVPIIDPVSVIASWYGSVGLEEGRNPENLAEAAANSRARPMELLGGVQFDLPSSLVAQAGGGSGLNGSVGSPDFRIFASFGYTPRVKDADGDGIYDDADGCPDEPEDKDGFEDGDGCPDTDNDNDSILDVDDECRDEAEDFDQFEDENGCPDPDNDNDGVLDGDDECPIEAGDPNNAGCPLVDTDGDGLFDPDDQCVNDPEDKDGFEDEDGCPDPDNDKDGIPDAEDKCPMEKEVINGFEDEDGCPDEGETKVRVTEKSIEILDKVYFNTNKDTIKEVSFNILNQVASILKANPQITKVLIEGHTDDRGKDDYNLDLSDRRAQSVMRYLTERGIDASRLEAKGYGETKPVADNKTAKGREDNRRVEFTIVEVDGKPVKKTTEVENEEGAEE